MVDPDGQSYSARITDTGGTSCEIHVKGLPANTECTFTLGGVAVRDGGSFGTVKGYFETPDIADDLIERMTTMRMMRQWRQSRPRHPARRRR